MPTSREAAPTPPGSGREEGFALAALVALLAVTAAWWALALWPVADAPVWLERTRYVCFGVAESGLPDAAGWVGLIGGPLGMLGILLVGWRDAFRRLAGRVRTSRPAAAGAAALALTCMAMMHFAGVRISEARASTRIGEPAEDPLPAATYPRLDRPAPALALTAQDGRLHSLEALRGRSVLVTFAYAHCATICPLIVKDVLEAQRLVASAGAAPAVLIVTLDPWRDTPSRLPAMAADWQLPAADAWVLSGAVAEVESALDAWEVPRSRDARTGAVDHPSLAYVVDPAGRLAYASTGGARAIAELVRRASVAADPEATR